MGAVLLFFIYVIIVCVIAYVVLWAVQRFFAELYPIARVIVGAFALIAILWKLYQLLQSGIPGLG